MEKVIGLVGIILVLVGFFAIKASKERNKKKWIACIAVGIVFFIASCFAGGSSGGERTMGKCWICGKDGSFQMDGSYYCFKHYNDRLSGRFD